MTKFIWGSILMILAIGCGNGFEKKEPKKQRTQNAQEVDSGTNSQEYLELVNEHRIKLKLKPLTYNLAIENVARMHSKGMALHSRPFGHFGFAQRCRKLKRLVGRHTQCGEVVAQGQRHANDVFNSWLQSPVHRKEIENPDYTMTGLGIYKNESGVTYWTQILIEL